MALSALRAPFCATCIRDDVPLSDAYIDGRRFSLCADCSCDGLDADTSAATDELSTPQRVTRFLRHSGGASASEILLALGCPGDNKEADTVRKAISRMRERGTVEAVGPVDTRGLAVYRLARRL
jgi:hypothetical protein